MSDSTDTTYEPVEITPEDISFFDSFKDLNIFDNKANDRTKMEELHVRSMTLFGMIIQAGYQGDDRKKVYRYFNSTKWDKHENPAYCLCDGKQTCWICKLNSLRDWADKLHVEELPKLRKTWEESMHIPKYDVLGRMTTCRELADMLGIAKVNVNKMITRYGEIEGVARLLKYHGDKSIHIQLLKAQKVGLMPQSEQVNP